MHVQMNGGPDNGMPTIELPEDSTVLLQRLANVAKKTPSEVLEIIIQEGERTLNLAGLVEDTSLAISRTDNSANGLRTQLTDADKDFIRKNMSLKVTKLVHKLKAIRSKVKAFYNQIIDNYIKDNWQTKADETIGIDLGGVATYMIAKRRSSLGLIRSTTGKNYTGLDWANKFTIEELRFSVCYGGETMEQFAERKGLGITRERLRQFAAQKGFPKNQRRDPLWLLNKTLMDKKTFCPSLTPEIFRSLFDPMPIAIGSVADDLGLADSQRRILYMAARHYGCTFPEETDTSTGRSEKVYLHCAHCNKSIVWIKSRFEFRKRKSSDPEHYKPCCSSACAGQLRSAQAWQAFSAPFLSEIAATDTDKK